MIPTKEYIEQRFERFNQLMFEGKLPKPQIKLSKAKTYLGMCVAKKRRTLLGKTILYDFKLRISTFYDLPEQEVEDTIIHEMIHYYIGLNKLKDTSSHGKLFRQIMNSINERHGRHLTISHKATKEQREQAVNHRRKWNVVAVITFKDGKTGIKVLPRIKERILHYHNNVITNIKVKSIQLYMSSDVFFNKYPCSSALNVIYIDKEELFAHITNAEMMQCDGKSIVRGN